MGFGPRMPDIESGVKAVTDLIELLYPERSTPEAIEWLAASARALLSARAALTFANIDRFWRDPDWRKWILDRVPQATPGPWDAYRQQSVAPSDLDQNFGWLVQDRLEATRDD